MKNKKFEVVRDAALAAAVLAAAISATTVAQQRAPAVGPCCQVTSCPIAGGGTTGITHCIAECASNRECTAGAASCVNGVPTDGWPTCELIH